MPGMLHNKTHPRARRQIQVGKTVQRWYLPKLHYWLAFSLEDTVQRKVVG
jgi:hypothetical protein